MSEIKLLPCPFCGGEAELDIDDLGNWLVRCKKCFCRTSRSMSKFYPTVSWNTRKPMRDIVKRLEKKIDNRLYDPNWNAGIIAAISVVESEGGMGEVR